MLIACLGTTLTGYLKKGNGKFENCHHSFNYLS